MCPLKKAEGRNFLANKGGSHHFLCCPALPCNRNIQLADRRCVDTWWLCRMGRGSQNLLQGAEREHHAAAAMCRQLPSYVGMV